MELTREEAIANFREHWNWQSKHPKVDKEDAPMVRGKRLTFDCFAIMLYSLILLRL